MQPMFDVSIPPRFFSPAARVPIYIVSLLLFFLLTPFLFSALSSHSMSSFSSSLSSTPAVAAHNTAPPLFLSTLLMLTSSFYSYGCLPFPPRSFPPSDCLLVGMQAWTPIVPSCLSALSFSISLSTSLSLFLFPAPSVHCFYQKNSTKKKESGGQGLLGEDKWMETGGRKRGYGLWDKGMFSLKGRIKKEYKTLER